jgi:hypothetical protein
MGQKKIRMIEDCDYLKVRGTRTVHYYFQYEDNIFIRSKLLQLTRTVCSVYTYVYFKVRTLFISYEVQLTFMYTYT